MPNIFDLSTEHSQRSDEFRDRTLVHAIDASDRDRYGREERSRCEKTHRSPGIPKIKRDRPARAWLPSTLDTRDAKIIPLALDVCAEHLHRIEHDARIVRVEQRPPKNGDPVRKSREQNGTVGQALGPWRTNARHLHQ